MARVSRTFRPFLAKNLYEELLLILKYTFCMIFCADSNNENRFYVRPTVTEIQASKGQKTINASECNAEN